MTDTHLTELPTPGDGPTFHEMAVETDKCVAELITELREGYPALGGAMLSGALSALTRYQLAGMPPQTSGQQVLEIFAPIIHHVASQIAEGRRVAAGLPVPKAPIMAPIQQAFQALTDRVGMLPYATFVIRQVDHLLLVSVQLSPEGVLTYGCTPDILASIRQPDDVLKAHIMGATAQWIGRDSHAV